MGTKNDWEDDIDDWDDWGDAEDNFPEENIAVTKKENVQNFNNNDGKLEQVLQQTPVTSDVNYNKNENPLNKKEESKTSTWNVWKVLSTATEGLGNITSTVSQGLNQVIGVPDPEELARIHASEVKESSKQFQDEQTKSIQTNTTDSTQDNRQPTSQGVPNFGLSLVSGVTTLGSKVINTGLDTLEGIGKKTMNILQENDPLLKNKRKILGLEPDRPNLSEVLKEAKNDADQIENQLKELKIEKSRNMLRFEIIFENNCGLVHLEALEILSKESGIKLTNLLSSVSGNALSELQETIDEVKELMELEDLEGESDGDYSANELNERLLNTLEDADLNINFDDIIKVWTQTLDWLESSTDATEEDIFSQAIHALSETCALEMTKLHKIAELLLVKEHHSTASEVDSIVQICKQFNMHLNGLTNRFATTLMSKNNEASKPLITTLFDEMLVAMKHMENAFKLFLPILQIGAA